MIDRFESQSEMLLLPLVIPSPLLDHLLPLPIFPLAQLDLEGAAAEPALVHLPYGARAVLRIEQAHEAVPPRLTGGLVVHDSRHVEGGVLRECLLEVILLQVLGEVANEEAEVFLWPLGEGGVRPGLAGGRTDVRPAVAGGRGRGGRRGGRMLLRVEVMVGGRRRLIR